MYIVQFSSGCPTPADAPGSAASAGAVLGPQVAVPSWPADRWASPALAHPASSTAAKHWPNARPRAAEGCPVWPIFCAKSFSHRGKFPPKSANKPKK